MKTRLDKDTIKYVEDTFNGISPGSEVKTNHINCPAGTDTRSRLYVRKTEDGRRLLAHCFNCGGSSASKTGLFLGEIRTAGERLKELSNRNEIVYHRRIYGSYKCGPLSKGVVHLKPHCYFKGEDEVAFHSYDAFGCKFYSLAHEDVGGTYRVYVPRDNGVQFVEYPKPPGGWTMIFEDDSTSKIVIYRPDPTKGIVDDNPVAVVCEDVFSAMKVCLAGHVGIALCGTSLSTEEAFKLGLLFDRFLVWLDNDSDIVKTNATVVRNRLMLYTPDAVPVEYDQSDPKLYSCKDIVKTIRKHHK